MLKHLPFRASAFDDIVSVRSFHFLPNPEAFLNKANRVLNPTGRITVSFEKSIRGREIVRKLLSLPPSGVKRKYYANRHVACLMRRAGFKTLLVRNVTKLPLLVYWRTKDDRILRSIHPKIPDWFGTLGVAAGQRDAPLRAAFVTQVA